MQGGLENSLREQRRARGVTQAALAEAIGVSRKTINTIENGIFVPSTVLALKLARYFDCPVEALFTLQEAAGITGGDAAPAKR